MFEPGEFEAVWLFAWVDQALSVFWPTWGCLVMVLGDQILAVVGCDES